MFHFLENRNHAIAGLSDYVVLKKNECMNEKSTFECNEFHLWISIIRNELLMKSNKMSGKNLANKHHIHIMHPFVIL